MPKLILAALAAFMSDVLPTVKIKTVNGPVDINLSDFDKDKHELADPAEMEPLKPLDPAKQEALFGSSAQPTSWLMPDGSILQLGTIVAEAHKRSGLTVAQWNKMAQAKREKAIADMVAEMVPAPAPTFTIGQSGRAPATKFFILDSAGKKIGEEFNNEEDAKAQIELLTEEQK